MTDETTTPPASPEAKAMRAIGHELDVVGDALTSLAANTETLAELGAADASVLRRIDFNVAQILKAIGPLADRVSVLEQWRGGHERKHTEQ